MTYSFSNLSPADFEDLVRDLIGEELGVRFEGFGAGPDGGLDGRHAVGSKSIVLQAKHYAGSQIRSLMSAMRRERASINKLRPKRYLLATSRALTPANKAALAKIIGPALKSEEDIFSPTDLNALLRKFPQIEKANIKLWLSGVAVLERVIRSAAYVYTAISRAEIEAKVKVYAQNPSFKEARDKLESNHVVIISGPPGVGKTTLAEMLTYAYVGEEWEFVAIRSLEDGFAAIVDAKKQIFFFDDFLGKVALDTRALATKDSDLAKFIKRVRLAPNARFILTTRAPIFEEARRVSEHLADPRLDIVKYVLDVGIYTRRIRARILYNHLFVAGISQELIRGLWGSGAIPKIVDHKNYNPRIIEAMTDGMHTRDITPDEYAISFLKALDNPHQLWDTAFRTHIPVMCRHFLIALFFCSEYGVEMDELKTAFNAFHSHMCKQYGLPLGVKEFEEALKILEGGFISITGHAVDFINPSVRDYLTDYLDDAALLSAVVLTTQKANSAQAVWHHIQAAKKLSAEDKKLIAGSFSVVAAAFPSLPVFKRDPSEPNTYRYFDLGVSDRISLLLEWFAATNDNRFMDIALTLTGKPVGGFSPWRDGATLIKLIEELRNGPDKNLNWAIEFSTKLEECVIDIFNGHIWPDDLATMWDAMDETRQVLSDDVFEAAKSAIARVIDDATTTASEYDSESTLTEHIEAIQRLAPHANVPTEKLREAVSEMEKRISEIGESASEASPPEFSGRSRRESDKFDDTALSNLFAPLVNG